MENSTFADTENILLITHHDKDCNNDNDKYLSLELPPKGNSQKC